MATVDRCCCWPLGSMNVRHNWLVCKLYTAPTVDKKALPSRREEFQFSLMSKTWKSTGTRALPICTSRAVTISPEETDMFPNRPRTSSSMAIGPRGSQAWSLHSDRARAKFGRYVATEHERGSVAT
ncbi:hypothetical protein F2Q70_00025802 [Brassica cretica]|uniref:Uncharacterized protein n=1 Tax=Brassica cretica TaxID=69181 RepID=A0A8S9LHK8_BRACR|nr:hypothetical protein F2Q70_00025802 [Brassica cretica]